MFDNLIKGKPADDGDAPAHQRPEFIEVGQIVNTHGVQGEMKLNPMGYDPEFIAKFKYIYIDGIAIAPVSKRIHKGCVLLMLPDVTTMDAATAYRGKFVSIRRKDAHLPKNEYFDEELVGMTVYNYFPRRKVGVIEEVLTYPAHKLYRVRGEQHEYLIPAVWDVFIADILPDEGTVLVRMIEGLEVDAD